VQSFKAANFSLISFCRLVSLSVSVVILTTLLQLVKKKVPVRQQNTLSQFLSLKKNIKDLFSLDDPSPDSIKCFHGIRAISALSLMFFHSYFFRLITPFGDEQVFEDWKKTSWSHTISCLNSFVDSFFVMSAILTTRSMLRDLKK
jgi:hypothetical protein